MRGLAAATAMPPLLARCAAEAAEAGGRPSDDDDDDDEEEAAAADASSARALGWDAGARRGETATPGGSWVSPGGAVSRGEEEAAADARPGLDDEELPAARPGEARAPVATPPDTLTAPPLLAAPRAGPGSGASVGLRPAARAWRVPLPGRGGRGGGGVAAMAARRGEAVDRLAAVGTAAAAAAAAAAAMWGEPTAAAAAAAATAADAAAIVAGDAAPGGTGVAPPA